MFVLPWQPRISSISAHEFKDKSRTFIRAFQEGEVADAVQNSEASIRDPLARLLAYRNRLHVMLAPKKKAGFPVSHDDAAGPAPALPGKYSPSSSPRVVFRPAREFVGFREEIAQSLGLPA
jgi:hypothetical protein